MNLRSSGEQKHDIKWVLHHTNWLYKYIKGCLVQPSKQTEKVTLSSLKYSQMMMHKNNCNKLLLENRKNVTFTPNIPFLIRGPMHDKPKGFMSHGQPMTNVL